MFRVQIEWTPNMRGATLMLLTESVELHWSVVVGKKAFVAYDQPTKQSDKVKVLSKLAPALHCPYKRKAFIFFDSSFVCSDASKFHITGRTSLSSLDVLLIPRPPMSDTRTQWSLDKSDLHWPLTVQPLFSQGVGSLSYHASLMQSDGSRSGRGLERAQPEKNEAGGRRGTKRDEKEIKHGLSMKHPAPMVCLGWQRVVIAFAALALTAQDDGSGQKEEGGGHQQEKAETSKNPNNLCSVPDNRRPGVA